VKSKRALLFTGILVCVLLRISTATPQAVSSPSYGLEWPGDGSVRRMLYWHNPFPIYDATYVFKVYPRKKTSGTILYYTTFFWGNDGRFDWDNGNDNSYYGAHPYPIPAPGGPGQWEIAVWGGDYVTGREVQWGRWYTQVFRAWRESPYITHHEFYWDWPDTSKVISQTVQDPNWAHKDPPIPAIVIGQAPDFNGASWGGYPGWEEFDGIIRGIQIYSGLLSMADLQSEINAPQSTTAGQNLIWYLNTDPRPGDVADKKGRGTSHNPLWAGTPAFEWTDQSTDATPPSAPTNLTAAVVSSGQINLSWTASTDNVGVTGYSVERCQGSACTNFTQISTPGGTSYSDTGLSASTTYRYRVRATDAAGNWSSYSSIASAATPTPLDTIPPTVTMTAPASGTTVSGTITVSANASDNVGVVGVQFKLGGVNLAAEATSAPYSISWNTTTVANGSYTLTAVARDAAGNQTTSASVTVRLNNPPPLPDAGSTITFTIPADGGQSWVTTGQTGSLTVGYGRVQQDTGNSGLSGLAIFGHRPAGVLVTEASVPASPAMDSGRIYVELKGPVNTGIAFANPNAQPAVISFYFTDTAGNDSVQRSFTLNANSQLAAFLDQPPFNGGATQGTFTFSSSVPVGVVAIRGLINERGEFLITTLPVWATVDTNNNPIVLPHFADGGGWTTQVVLTNPSSYQLSGYAQFFSQNGTILNLAVNGLSSTRFDYLIPPRSSFRLVTGNSGSTVQAGSVRITPTGTAPAAAAIFSFKNNGITVSEAGVSALTAGLAFRMYVEASGSPGQIGFIESGFAIANPSAAPVNVNLELVGMDGSSPVPRVNLIVPANGQMARFVHELFPALNGSFQGFLKTTASAPIGVTGVRGRQNERGDFLITTTLPRNDDPIPTGSQLVFPHIASGGGYTTQFIIYGQPGSGKLWFSPLNGAVLSTNTPAQVP